MMYDIMHRTQLLIEQWQHQALQARARREGKSLSALLREILTEFLQDEGRSRLLEIEGIAEGPGLAIDHDKVIYDEEI